MPNVFFALSISLDGYVAGPNDEIDPLHDWVFAEGPESGTNPNREALEQAVNQAGAIVVGRRTFEAANRWGGSPPFPVPFFVVTHDPPPDAPDFIFVTEGVEAAIARAKEVCGDRDVSVGGAEVPNQAIAAGLVDEFQIFLVPVLLGSGKRLFEHIGGRVDLERTRVVEGPGGVTQLRFRVRRQSG